MRKTRKFLSQLIAVTFCGIFTTFSFLSNPLSANAKAYTYEFDDQEYTLDIGDTATVVRDGIKMTVQIMDDGSIFRIIKCEKLIKSERPKNSNGFCLIDNSPFSKYTCMSICDIKDKAFYKSKINLINFNGEIPETFKYRRVFGVKSFAECKKLKYLGNGNAYTTFKKDSFANCTNLKRICVDYACTFEKNSFRNVKAEIEYDNVRNPSVTYKNDKKLQKSYSAIRNELKRAGFKKGSIIKVYNGEYNKRGVMRFKKIKL